MAASALILPNTFTENKTKSLGIVEAIEVPIDEQVVNSIRRDLERLDWKFKLPTKKNAYPTLVPPES